MGPFFVYMLRCTDGSLYVNQTDDLEKCLGEHSAGKHAYTDVRRPVELIWWEQFSNKEESLATEQKIKGWNRAKKEALTRNGFKAPRRAVPKNQL